MADPVKKKEEPSFSIFGSMEPTAAPRPVMPPDPYDPDNLSTLDVWAAMFRDNIPISAWASRGIKPNFKAKPGYDSLKDIKGFEMYAVDLALVKSPEEMVWRKERLTEERADAAILEDSGWIGVFAAIGSGLANPLVTIPAIASFGSSLGWGALGREMLVAATSESVNEAAMHKLRVSRTWQQSAMNIGAATVFTGLAGSAGRLMTPAEKKAGIEAVRKALYEDAEKIPQRIPDLEAAREAPGATSPGGIATTIPTPPAGRGVDLPPAAGTPSGRPIDAPGPPAERVVPDATIPTGKAWEEFVPEAAQRIREAQDSIPRLKDSVTVLRQELEALISHNKAVADSGTGELIAANVKKELESKLKDASTLYNKAKKEANLSESDMARQVLKESREQYPDSVPKEIEPEYLTPRQAKRQAEKEIGPAPKEYEGGAPKQGEAKSRTPEYSEWEASVRTRVAELTGEAPVAPSIKSIVDDNFMIKVTADASAGYAKIAKAGKASVDDISKIIDDLTDEEAAAVLDVLSKAGTKDVNWNLSLAQSARDLARRAGKIVDEIDINAPTPKKMWFNPKSSIGEDAAEKALVDLFENTAEGVPIHLNTVLDIIGAKSVTSGVKWLVNRIKGLGLDIKVVTRSNLDAPATYRTQFNRLTGETSVEPGTRQIIIRTSPHDTDLVKNTLHEAIHAATLHALTMDNKFYAVLAGLHKEAVRLAKDQGVKFYGLTDVAEFVAELFTDGHFQKWLKAQKVENTNLWNKIVDLVTSFFGDPTKRNMLDAAMSVSNEFFTPEARIVAQGPKILPHILDQINEVRLKSGLSKIEVDIDQFAPQKDAGPSTTGAIGEFTKIDVNEKILSIASVGNPLVRMMTSPSGIVRDITERLLEIPMTLQKNLKGIKSAVSVETLIKTYNGSLGDALTATRDIFTEYAGVITGPAKFQRAWLKMSNATEGMSWAEFRNVVGETINSGTQHKNALVNKAAGVWRNNIFNKLIEKGVKSELLPASYKYSPIKARMLMAMYDYDKIIRLGNQFEDDVFGWLNKSGFGIMPAGARAAANKVRQEILSNQFTSGIPKEMMVEIPRSYRTLDGKGGADFIRYPVPQELLAKWTLNDVELMGRSFNRRMSTELSLKEVFGSTDMADQFAIIKGHYDEMARFPDANVELLRKRMNQDLRDLRAMLDIFRGSFALPSDPSGALVKGARALRTWQYLTSLGAQMVSAIPDVTRPITTNGVLPYLGGLTKFLSNPQLARAEIKRMGIGLDNLLHNRAAAMANVHDIPTIYGRIERAEDAMAGVFGKVSLMDPWNALWKQFSGVMAADRLITFAEKGWVNLGAKKQQQLLQMGIDERTLDAIRVEARQHGVNDRGFYVANTGSWTNDWARQTFTAAITKEADTLIVTAGKGDRPLVFHTDAGKTVGQFMSFISSATNRMLLTGLSVRDMNHLNALVGGVGLGMLTVYIKRSLSNQPLPESPQAWAWHGVQQMGILGMPGEAMGAFGDLVGMGTYHKTVKEVLAERIVGASLSTMTHAGTVARGLAGAAFGEQWKEHETHAARTMVPFQNVFYLRTLFDAAEEGINAAVGAKPSKSKRHKSGKSSEGGATSY